MKRLVITPVAKRVDVVERSEVAGRPDVVHATVDMPPGSGGVRRNVIGKLLLSERDDALGKVMRRGRAKGAVSGKTMYLRDLATRHPGKTAKALYRVALREAPEGVFYEVGGELHDAKTDKLVSVEAFGKALSKATSQPKTEAKNLRKR